MMVSLDVYRPAAQEQLRALGEQNDILTFLLLRDSYQRIFVEERLVQQISMVQRLYCLIQQAEHK